MSSMRRLVISASMKPTSLAPSRLQCSPPSDGSLSQTTAVCEPQYVAITTRSRSRSTPRASTAVLALLLPAFGFPVTAVPAALVALAVLLLKIGLKQYCKGIG